MIRKADDRDGETIAGIYNYYIRETVITFEETPVTGGEMLARVKNVESQGLPWLVAEEKGVVLGYAYATKWNNRAAYRHTAESSVYLAAENVSRGWGTKLYDALFAELREKSIHVVIGGMTLPNPASKALHEKFGMEKVAHFKRVGYKFQKWLDVGYWQVELD